MIVITSAIVAARERVRLHLECGRHLAAADWRLVALAYLRSPANADVPPAILAERIDAGEHLTFFVERGAAEYLAEMREKLER